MPKSVFPVLAFANSKYHLYGLNAFRLVCGTPRDLEKRKEIVKENLVHQKYSTEMPVGTVFEFKKEIKDLFNSR